jgi:hypothetical protein
MSLIGAMAMPSDFRYRDVFLRGQPKHERYDLFRVRHPSMAAQRRAKIFSPFDALKGFNEAVASKDVLYREQIELCEEDRRELDRRLQILKGLTFNGRMARANQVRISVTYYVACEDENNEAFGVRGQYRTYSGICWNVDEISETILVDRLLIGFENIKNIENGEGIFQKDWDSDIPQMGGDILCVHDSM